VQNCSPGTGGGYSAGWLTHLMISMPRRCLAPRGKCDADYKKCVPRDTHCGVMQCLPAEIIPSELAGMSQ
jgi:hypothetical protein